MEEYLANQLERLLDKTDEVVRELSKVSQRLARLEEGRAQAERLSDKVEALERVLKEKEDSLRKALQDQDKHQREAQEALRKHEDEKHKELAARVEKHETHLAVVTTKMKLLVAGLGFGGGLIGVALAEITKRLVGG